MTVDTPEVAEESWQQVAKRRKSEKQEEVTLIRRRRMIGNFSAVETESWG